MTAGFSDSGMHGNLFSEFPTRSGVFADHRPCPAFSGNTMPSTPFAIGLG